jgi:hypothetical protein
MDETEAGMDSNLHMEISSIDGDIQNVAKSFKEFSKFGFGHGGQVHGAVETNVYLSSRSLFLWNKWQLLAVSRISGSPTNSSEGIFFK